MIGTKNEISPLIHTDDTDFPVFIRPIMRSLVAIGNLSCRRGKLRKIRSGLPKGLQGGIDGARFRAALVLIEIGLELLFGFVSIEEKLLSGAEGEAADVAVGVTGRGSYETHDS
jgi:hypothetical protein